MSEKHQDTGTPDCGRLLKRTRESLGLSVEDIASELHLSLRQIEALEKDDWDELPGITYARGYVRSYARLIGLDAEQLLAGATTEEIEISRVEPEISQVEPEISRVEPEVSRVEPEVSRAEPETSRAEPEITVEKTAEKTEGETKPPAVARPPWGPIAGIGVFAAAALLLWQFQQGALAPWIAGGEVDLSMQHEGEQIQEADGGTATVQPEAETVGGVPTGTTAETEVDATDQPSTPTEPQQVVFQFDQSSWIDVRDAGGNRLLYRNFQPGRRVEVEGEPPFRVFLGNARGVQVEYLGDTITPDTKFGRLYARFTLAPSG